MESKHYFRFEDLQIYQKAINFGESVNGQIMKFPKEETYRLASQFIRAADSIALNIAELSKMITSFKNHLKNRIKVKKK